MCLFHRRVLGAVCGMVLAACATTGPADVPIEQRLPAPGFADGWTMDGLPSCYDPKTVFDYIDGEAELYFPYGFAALATATYLHGGDAADAVTADVYAMGSVLDAFGIYSNYRYPGADKVAVGAEGHCDGYQIMFYQDRYFVRLSASGKPAVNPPNLTACAEAISKRLPANTAEPAELGLVAVDGVIRDSVKYIGESVLGYAFFPKGFIAQLDRAEQMVRIFVIFTESEATAAESLAAYTAYLKEEEGDPQTAGETVLAKDPLYKGVAVRQSGRYVLGVIGLADANEGLSVLEQLDARTAK
ncbi:MAG: hypothetical protein QG656_2391 [Candidatus Hydrogenedentes bacterium]|nr:hypothetical protein [Candidatus Hydrogenedentota bacterium]